MVLGLAERAAWCFLLLGISGLLAPQVHGQPGTQGFITIDCGIDESYNYTDEVSKITYTSDSGYVQTGTNYNVSKDYITASHPLQLSTLRSFPTGARNCYTLKPVESNLKHLIRATFFYGNYDGLNSATPENPLLFDLYLGANLWKTVNFTDASEGHSTEVIIVSSSEYIWVCLVNTGFGTPFISLLELRPLKNTIYPVVGASSPLVLQYRGDMGSDQPVRYPDDPYDRVWKPKNNVRDWTSISTTATIDSRPDDIFEAPSAVMRTAVAPVNASGLALTFTTISTWTPIGVHTRTQYYFIMHFAELQSIPAKSSRVFSIYLNGELFHGSYTPNYLLSGYIHTDKPEFLYQYSFLISQDESSALPPILNALEIYTVMLLPELATNSEDVEAIMAIKEQYQVKRNWAGDPCAPRAYSWDGLTCNYSRSDPPRIIDVNLSFSGLSGTISSSLANLATICYLDLSFNSLSGTIPDYLAELSSLQVLNLSNNQLTGSIPPSLLSRSENGSLILRIEGNPNLCANGGPCWGKKKKNNVTIIVLTSLTSMVLFLGLILYVWRIRRRRSQGIPVEDHNDDHSRQLSDHEGPFQFENQRFTYKDLVKITKNFERVIGKGGFGIVYHGCLETSAQVAVKMCSQPSPQATKQFVVEAQFFSRIHHRNLVSMVGYCNDRNSMALVFEYMAQGSLADHLSVCKAGNERSLSWGERLRIALEAAQGLEYLHKGCRPPIIHRDVKTSNILLTEKLEAKIADFGLSKAFQNDCDTHVSTMVAGTLGYLDPEYHNTSQLNEKSDVYSFGVVLLQLITGQPAILTSIEKVHISQWVNLKLVSGDITEIIDTRLQGKYEVNSIWKVEELAMKCVTQTSIIRPTMADVVLQLKESLELEAACGRAQGQYMEAPNSSISSLDMFNIGKPSELSGPSMR